MNKHDTTKATRIPREQKLVLCKRHSEYPKLLLRALSRWSGSAFNLSKNPSHATLLMLFKKHVTEDAVRVNSGRKTIQYVCCPSLEHALVLWINHCELLQMPVVTWGRCARRRRRFAAVSCATLPTSLMRSSRAWCSRMGGCKNYKSDMC